MTRRPLILFSVLLATLVWATPAVAGNWATATMDQPAPAPVAGVEVPFGFDILRHGVTPVSWVTATFVATDLATGQQVQAPMTANGPEGHYVTSVTFPNAGDWTWYVLLAELGTDQDGAGGTLTVVDATAAAPGLAAIGQRIGAALIALPAFARWLADARADAATTN
jgi:hypothetical protein